MSTLTITYYTYTAASYDEYTQAMVVTTAVTTDTVLV